MKHFRFKDSSFELGKKTYICGILNVTPDSFSDGGKYKTLDEALYAAERMCNEGADFLDIGGESTRPGHTPVFEDEEIERVVPVIEALKVRIPLPLSVDTMKAKVSYAAANAGASIINDVWGGKSDPLMLKTVYETGCGYIMGHNAVSPVSCGELFSDMDNFFETQICEAKRVGISEEYLCIDPGIGFAKSFDGNLSVLKRLERFHKFGFPIMIGVSRKSVIGNALSLPVSERLEGGLSIAAISILKGADFIRTHDVKATVRAAKMADLIARDEGV